MNKVKYFYRDEEAPKTNSPNHIGVNAIISYEDKYLLEYRKDNSSWGFLGGGLNSDESIKEGVIREVYEESGILLKEKDLEFYKIYDDPSRIVSYPDGNIKRIISIVFYTSLKTKPMLTISDESIKLKFFNKEELENISIAKTHIPILKDLLRGD